MTDRKTLKERFDNQQSYIADLERRANYGRRLVDHILKLEHELGLAKAAIADLKHKLFLIGNEEDIEAGIRLASGTVKPTRRKQKRK